MAYITNTDVQNEFRSITFSASGAALTTTEVDSIISQEEAFLDARLAGIYTTPITGTEALKVMKALSLMIVKARIESILAVKVGRPQPDQGNVSTLALERADKMIEAIQKREIILTDAPLASSDLGIKSYANDNTDTIEPKFQKEEEQW